MIEKMLCRVDGELADAMQTINANGKGIAFIINKEDKLCGLLTDGDIRRLLLKGYALQEKISKVMNRDFVYAKVGEDIKEMLAKVNYDKKVMPIVDENLKVVDFVEDRSGVHIPIAEPDLKGNELKYLIDAFLSTWISSKGEYIERLEKSFSHFCDCKYGVSVSSGTVALHLALLALGIGKGDEVIVPDLTFVATINAVLYTQATPVIVDIEKDSWCIDPKEVKKVITPKTKAIIPVHLYGQPCDMGALMAVARAHKLYVIEDCAEAHGACYSGKKVGSFGDIGCFSFFGNKIITTGEGGMCVTNSVALDGKMRILRDHGMSREKKYWHDMVGYNYRLTNLQAAIGVAQLERIEEILLGRKKIEEEYKRYLSDIPLLEFQRDDLPKRKKITWLVSALVKDKKRDEYLSELHEKNIDVRPFFYSLSLMPVYKEYVFSGAISRDISERGINFPTKLFLNKKTFSEIKEIFRDRGAK